MKRDVEKMTISLLIVKQDFCRSASEPSIKRFNVSLQLPQHNFLRTTHYPKHQKITKVSNTEGKSTTSKGHESFSHTRCRTRHGIRLDNGWTQKEKIRTEKTRLSSRQDRGDAAHEPKARPHVLRLPETRNQMLQLPQVWAQAGTVPKKGSETPSGKPPKTWKR